jgi:DNA (cytosine-5)-methyltransferase 1
MAAYYNENDIYAAQWLRNLITAGHIAPGDVDERSIKDVKADDLRGYQQAHFFAGIGGWPYALRLAGWPDDRPVWTGSCPCQPFSAAGAGKAADDERHLWPAWFSLIRELRPPTIFGEQVEAAIGWGWLDAVFADLEGEGYACGTAVLPACGVGAPHIRQRLWFLADADGGNASAEWLQRSGEQRQQPQDCGACRGYGWVLPTFAANITVRCASCRGTGCVADTKRDGRRTNEPQRKTQRREANGRPHPGDMADASQGGCGTGQRHIREPGRQLHPRGRGETWDCEWLPCTDGKARPVEPGTFPLAHGIPGRVGRLRAYGNAITPQVAAEFIRAFESG